MSTSPPGLDLPAPAVEALLREHYALAADSLQVFDSEVSTVCRVNTANGALMVKAVHHSLEEHAVARWRVAASEHLADHGVPVGRVVRNLDDELLSIAPTEQGIVTVHVGHWLEGVPLQNASLTPILCDVGDTAAQISRCLPTGHAHHFPWSIRELTRSLSVLEQVVKEIDDGPTRDLITESARRFAEYAPLLERLPRATAHHDLHDSNLLVDVVSGRICGVLDMGDMVPAPRVAELVVAAAYACRGAENPADAFVRVAEGSGSNSATERRRDLGPVPQCSGTVGREHGYLDEPGGFRPGRLCSLTVRLFATHTYSSAIRRQSSYGGCPP